MNCKKCKKEILDGHDYFESVDKPELKMHRNCFLRAKPMEVIRMTGIGGYNLKNTKENV